MPDSWEDRLRVYIAFLVQIIITDDQFVLASLVKTCKIKNDILMVRLPIQRGFLRLILDRMDEYYLSRSQPYLDAQCIKH